MADNGRGRITYLVAALISTGSVCAAMTGGGCGVGKRGVSMLNLWPSFSSSFHCQINQSRNIQHEYEGVEAQSARR